MRIANPLPKLPALLDRLLLCIVIVPKAGGFDPSIRIPAGIIPPVVAVLPVILFPVIVTVPYPAVAVIEFKRAPYLHPVTVLLENNVV